MHVYNSLGDDNTRKVCNRLVVSWLAIRNVRNSAHSVSFWASLGGVSRNFTLVLVSIHTGKQRTITSVALCVKRGTSIFCHLVFLLAICCKMTQWSLFYEHHPINNMSISVIISFSRWHFEPKVGLKYKRIILKNNNGKQRNSTIFKIVSDIIMGKFNTHIILNKITKPSF